MIHLHKLVLTGPHRQYSVDFDGRSSNLALIAGESNTGKTTILELVDFLLGDDRHPTHSELAQRVRSAMLEISIGDDRWTIERPMFQAGQVAYIREGSIDQPSAASRKVIEPAGDPNSMSSWLLEATGLGRRKLQVTEGNPFSAAHELSFRDVMWLAFLPSKRLDNEALLHDGHPQKHYKLRQVVEVLFGVHDSQLAQLLAQLNQLRDERREYEREVAALDTFLSEEEVPDLVAAKETRKQLASERDELQRQLNEVTRRASSSTDYARELRTRYGAARASAQAVASRLRDREALLDRLLPLRGQYAEDERKLVFFDEAKQLFDPLSIDHCPACLQALSENPVIQAGRCSLCREAIAPTDEPAFALDRERRLLRRRIKDLDAYMQQVEGQITDARAALERSEASVSSLAAELDSQTSQDLSPFIAQRDEFLQRISSLDAETTDLGRAIRWIESLERRRHQVQQTEATIRRVSDSLAALRANQPDRRMVVEAISTRFAQLLQAWEFPKVDDPEPPYVNENFVPYVRGRAYREIGSDGALTLISVAWMLSIFELAVEAGAPHPGFLMLDGVQKNLAPRRQQVADEYMDPAIVDRMYSHIATWTRDHPEAQIIIVDHRPPDAVDDRVIVRYSRRADRPPYGLIDDETGRRIDDR